MNNKISIVIATRNRAALLRAAILSAQRQTWPDTELVVVDEASTDATAALLDTEFPKGKVVRHDAPRGPSGARNAGAAASSGNWIVFCDDDDLMHPGHVEKLLTIALAAPDKTFVTGRSRDFAILGERVVMGPLLRLVSVQSNTERLVQLLEPSNPRLVTPGAVLWPRALFDALTWDETLRFYEDFDLYGRAMLAGWQMLGCDAGLYFIRVHGGPRLTTSGDLSSVLSSAAFRLKWSALLQASPQYQGCAEALRNGLMDSLLKLSGRPEAPELIPGLQEAFKAWGGRAFYITPPPQHWFKRAAAQAVLRVGGPSALRQVLTWANSLKPAGPSFVSGLSAPQTVEDHEAAAFVLQYR